MEQAPLQTKRVPISGLSSDPGNARLHSDRNLEAIKRSLSRFGQQKPIVVDSSGTVRAGNGTLQAATALGWENISVVVSDLSEADMTAFAIADNRTAELAEWDEEMLAATLEALMEEADVPLADAGFTAEELAEVQKAAGADEVVEIVEDEVPKAPQEPITKVGDLWILGRHRLLCGDSTDGSDVKELMMGKEARVIFTDPPYGIDYSDMAGRFEKILNDATDPTELVAAALRAHSPEAVFLCCNWRCLQAMMDALARNNLQPKSTIVWDKGSRIQNLERFAKRHEFLVYSGPFGGQKTVDEDVWKISRERRGDHPTAKPVELCARAIGHTSDPNDIIVDPFLGSGSTLIAAEQLGRSCYGMELSPAYCDVIVRRWENLTGEKAVLEQ